MTIAIFLSARYCTRLTLTHKLQCTCSRAVAAATPCGNPALVPNHADFLGFLSLAFPFLIQTCKKKYNCSSRLARVYHHNIPSLPEFPKAPTWDRFCFWFLGHDVFYLCYLCVCVFYLCFSSSARMDFSR